MFDRTVLPELKKRLGHLFEESPTIREVGQASAETRAQTKLAKFLAGNAAVALLIGGLGMAGTPSAAQAGPGPAPSPEIQDPVMTSPADYIQDFVSRMERHTGDEERHRVLVLDSQDIAKKSVSEFASLLEASTLHPGAADQTKITTVHQRAAKGDIFYWTPSEDDQACVISPKGESVSLLNKFSEVSGGLPSHVFNIPRNQYPYLAYAINIHETTHCLENHWASKNGIEDDESKFLMDFINEAKADRNSLTELRRLSRPEASAAALSVTALRTIGDVHFALDGRPNDHATGFALRDPGKLVTPYTAAKYLASLDDFAREVQETALRIYDTDHSLAHKKMISTPEGRQWVFSDLLQKNPHLVPATVQAMIDTDQLSGRHQEIAAQYLEALERVAPALINEEMAEEARDYIERHIVHEGVRL